MEKEKRRRRRRGEKWGEKQKKKKSHGFLEVVSPWPLAGNCTRAGERAEDEKGRGKGQRHWTQSPRWVRLSLGPAGAYCEAHWRLNPALKDS